MQNFFWWHLNRTVYQRFCSVIVYNLDCIMQFAVQVFCISIFLWFILWLIIIIFLCHAYISSYFKLILTFVKKNSVYESMGLIWLKRFVFLTLFFESWCITSLFILFFFCYWLLIFAFTSIITSMAWNSLLCADVPLRNHSRLAHSFVCNLNWNLTFNLQKFANILL